MEHFSVHPDLVEQDGSDDLSHQLPRGRLSEGAVFEDTVTAGLFVDSIHGPRGIGLLSNNHNGISTLSGTPAAGTSGTSTPSFVIPGARGKGGKNYTGSYSGSAEIE